MMRLALVDVCWASVEIERSRKEKQKADGKSGDSGRSPSFVQMPTLEQQASRNAKLSEEYASQYKLAKDKQLQATGGESLTVECMI